MMQPMRVVMGIAGLMLSAAAVQADLISNPVKTGDTVTLFGQKYTAEVHLRDGTYANGVKIVLQGPADQTTQKANLCFVQGADPSADRLFVAAPIGTNTDGPTGDQLYLLTGADTNGLFNTKNSKATQYLGGNVDRSTGGRPVMVAWITDADTGVKKDRNLAVMFFTDADKYRFYDFDSLSGGDYISDALLEIQQPEEDESVADPGMPDGDFEATAPTPNGMLLVAGNGIADSNGDRTPELGVMDPTKNAFFNVKTRLVDATKNAAIAIDPPTDLPQSLTRLPGSNDEYWLLMSQDGQGDDDNTSTEALYRLKITVPTDLANAKPGDIKVDVLAKEDILSKNLGSSTGGIFGFTLGRLGASGMPTIYAADWHGNLITLTPTP
jgi:hypothetical protein